MPEHVHGDASLHYEIVGDGPPLLLIAGLASDGASWGPLLTELPGRQLIVVDNRGAGRTRSAGPIRFADLVADIASLLEALGVGPVDVVGHSLGGAIGLWLAAEHPHLVKRLVTLTSGGVSPSKSVPRILTTAAAVSAGSPRSTAAFQVPRLLVRVGTITAATALHACWRSNSSGHRAAGVRQVSARTQCIASPAAGA